MKTLERCWLPVAWTTQIDNKPFATELLDRKIVIFRDKKGKLSALKDYCPHRGVQLSKGKIIEEGIQCPYHGWVFNVGGQCVNIPSLIEKDNMPHLQAEKYSIQEKQNTIWVSLSEDPYLPQPPDWQFYDKRGFVKALEMDCEYIRLIENLVDNPHAGFIHAGLLRGKPKYPVTANVAETDEGVLITTNGEIARSSILQTIFGDAQQYIAHTEEFVVPNIVRTNFRQGQCKHISSQFVCVPINDRKTRVFYRSTLELSTRFAEWVLFPLFRKVVNKILFQDKLMLENEAMQAWTHPQGQRISTKSDLPALVVAQRAKSYAEVGPLIKNGLKNKKSRQTRYIL